MAMNLDELNRIARAMVEKGKGILAADESSGTIKSRFAKWRATYTPTQGRPSYNCINANGQALARYAALCQEENIVPIVEPEVLMDFDNGIEACEAVTEWVLKETFAQLYYANVAPEGMVLKPNMVISGKKSE